jgi:hypothetical protein
MEEIWKHITGYDNNYMVSNMGRVMSIRYGKRIMKAQNSKGYNRICLHKNKLQYYHSIHRLVAIEFIDNPMNLPNINHIDFNRSNNNISNLEWVTQKQNVIHSHVAGRCPRKNGEAHPRAKLTDIQVEEIRMSPEKLNVLAIKYNVSESHLWKIKHNSCRPNVKKI